MKNIYNKRRNASTLRMYQELEIALKSLLSSKSFDSIGVVEICEKANVPRTTFYNHFEDKYDFLRYCVSEMIRRIIKEPNNDCSKEEYLGLMVSELCSFVDGNRGLIRNLDVATTKNIMMDELRRFVAESLMRRFEYVYKDRTFSVPETIIAQFHACGIINLIKLWIENPNKYTVKELSDFINQLIDVKNLL